MLRSALSAFVGLLLCSAVAHADDPWLVRLQPRNPAHQQSFGETLAFGSGKLLVVGAPDAAGTGVVLVFRRDLDRWVQEIALVPQGMTQGARFGAALSLSGGTGGAILDVGAPNASPGGIHEAGEVRTYQRDAGGNWSPRWTLTSPQPVVGGHFGAAVYGSGWLFIGEPDNGPGRVTLWTHPNQPDDWFSGPSGVPDAQFGAALAGSSWRPYWCVEFYLYIGAPGARSVYALNECRDVFRTVGYCGDPSLPGFGRRLTSFLWWTSFPDMGEHVLVGHDGPGVELWSDSFSFGPTRLASFAPFDRPEAPGFGADFALVRTSDSTAEVIVGHPGASMGGAPQSGGAYCFGLDGLRMTEHGGLAPYTRLPAEGTGTSVAVSGSLVALGAPSAGVVQIFDWSEPLGTPWCASEFNSRGATPVLYALGSEVLADRQLGFMAVGLPPGQPALLVGSSSSTWTPLGHGQAGARCVAPPFVRFVNEITTSDAGGRAIVRIDPLALPGGLAVAVGETWTFQYWYRDAAATLPTNTTHAIQVTFE